MTSRARSSSGARDFIRFSAMRMGASGLRSSWPSMARNSSLLRPICASCRASASVFWCATTDSVTSTAWTITPRIPAADREGWATKLKTRPSCPNSSGNSVPRKGSSLASTSSRMRQVGSAAGSGSTSRALRPTSSRRRTSSSKRGLASSKTCSGPPTMAMDAGACMKSEWRCARCDSAPARATFSSRSISSRSRVRSVASSRRPCSRVYCSRKTRTLASSTSPSMGLTR